MFWPQRCNRHAVLFLLILAGVLVSPVVPVRAAGYFIDQIGVNGDLFGRSASELEDINSDGNWEFLVGMPGKSVSDAGQVFFWYGGTGLTVAPDVVWTGSNNEMFGWCVARIGDVNDDNVADFAVGAPWADNVGTNAGRVYVFFGGSLTSGTAAAQADVVIDGALGSDGFGYAISAAGDFDGDGIDDFIVGAPDVATPPTKPGSAFVIYGANGGPSSDLADATVLSGPVAGGRFGFAVSDAGDFLGGPEMSVAVGAPLLDNFGLDAGAVYVYEGRTGGATPDAVADATITSGAVTVANGNYGFSLCNAGRWSGDGLDDLAVGAPYDSGGLQAGRVEIVFGANSPSTSGDRYAVGRLSGDRFGYALADVRDVDGTSADDVLVGAPFENSPASDGGWAYVFTGGSSSQNDPDGLVGYANVPLRVGTAADDHYGTAVASAGDFDGDGQWDFAVGAPDGNNEPSGAVAGFVHLIHTTAGPVANELQSWRAEWNTDAGALQVELRFAFAVPAGQVVDLSLVRRTRDATGGPVSEQLVWSGRPDPAATASGSGLFRDGAGYGFVDTGVDALDDGAFLVYDVTATTDDGRTLVLTDLAGPAGPAPVFGLAVGRVWPNPGHGSSPRVRFRAAAGDPVSVDVFDVRGHRVRSLHAGVGTGVWQDVAWDGRDEAGGVVAAGVYQVLVTSPEGTRHARLVLVR